MRMLLFATVAALTAASAGCAAPFDVVSAAEREGVAPVLSRGHIARLHGAINELDRATAESLRASARVAAFTARSSDEVFLDPARIDEEIAGLEDAWRATSTMRDWCRHVCGLGALAVDAYDHALMKLDAGLNRGYLQGMPAEVGAWRMYQERLIRARQMYARRVQDVVRAMPAIETGLERLEECLARMRQARAVH